jgi:hypothetical protein
MVSQFRFLIGRDGFIAFLARNRVVLLFYPMCVTLRLSATLIS